MFKLKMQQRVKDTITGFEGVITARTEYLNGCVQYCVKPTKLKENGSMKDAEWFDEQQLEKVRRTPTMARAEKKATGGPQRDQSPKSPV